MRVIITAGGTGGHIYPALAILDKIKEMEPDSEFIYIGTHNRMEKDIVPNRGIRYIPLEIYGLSTSLKLMGRNIKNIGLISRATKKCMQIMREFKPDAVIGVGGYVTYPVIKAAHKCGIKTFVHEQNGIPGKANIALHRSVTQYWLSFKSSLEYFKNYPAIVLGNPCSEAAIKAKKISKTNYGLTKNKKAVLIFSGSLGSTAMNQSILDYLKMLDNANYEVLYITGKSSYEAFMENKLPKCVHVVPYIDNLCGLMKDMDVIVSRAGASSMAEITALGIPCILIPSPYVANNHQYYNALAIVENDAGVMIQQRELTPDLLKTKIEEILNDDKLAKKYSDNLKAMCEEKPATEIYKNIKEHLNK